MQTHLVTNTGDAACGAQPEGGSPPRLSLTDALDLVDCPACEHITSAVYSAAQLRDECRAIMRAGGDEPPSDHWWPADLVREITEWHDAGRPNAAKTVAALERCDEAPAVDGAPAQRCSQCRRLKHFTVNGVCRDCRPVTQREIEDSQGPTDDELSHDLRRTAADGPRPL